jgi:hypothetical protein
MSKDLNIIYYGGSGGFYLLHQLLISKEFICFFHKEVNYDTIRFKNFNINSLNEWKNSEIIPDNVITAQLKTKIKKIYFHNNDVDEWTKYSGKKILLYTDLKSQLRLCYAKKAGIFLNNKCSINEVKNVLNGKKNYCYNNLDNEIFKDCYKIKLQDILTVSGLEKMLTELNCNLKQENIDFLNYYLRLHPKKLLEKIGIKDV